MVEKKKPISEKKKFKIEVIDSPEIERIYSNYVSVTTTPHECNLTFCHIDPLDRSPSKADAKVVAKITLPNSLVEETLSVIQGNFDRTMKKLKEIKSKK